MKQHDFNMIVESVIAADAEFAQSVVGRDLESATTNEWTAIFLEKLADRYYTVVHKTEINRENIGP